MDRVYKSDAAGSPPTYPASPSSGYPQEGDALTATPATKPGPWWFYMVTEELRNAIVALGVTPDGEEVNQLGTGLDALIDAVIAKANLASPSFTGNPTAPTPSPGDSDTSIATTGFVAATLATKADLASPTFTGNPTAPTPSPGDSDTSIATTGFVAAALATVPLAYSAIAGFLPSGITGSSTTAALTVSAGQASDSTNAVAIAKASTTAWAVTNGTNINGYQGGTTLPNSDTIHFFACKGTSGVGIWAHNSLTPTPPAGYNTSYRRIFSVNTNSSGALIPYNAVEAEGGSIIAWLATQTLDVQVANLGTSRVAYALNVPTDIKVMPFIRSNTPTGSYIILTSGDETDVAPTGPDFFTAAPGCDVLDNLTWGVLGNNTILTTDTDGKIGARANTTSVTFRLVTRGFKDFRRA